MILARAGLGLDAAALKRLRWAAARLAAVPCLVEAGVVDVYDTEDDVVVMDESDLRDWSVKRLKALMMELGVEDDACVEKDDLVAALFASGRVVASPAKDAPIEPSPEEPEAVDAAA